MNGDVMSGRASVRPPGDNGTFWTDGVSVVSPDSQPETDVDMSEAVRRRKSMAGK